MRARAGMASPLENLMIIFRFNTPREVTLLRKKIHKEVRAGFRTHIPVAQPAIKDGDVKQRGQ